MPPCGLPGGVRLEFPKDEIEVVVREADIRSSRRGYTVASFRVSDDAGRLISRYASTRALVYIKLQGNRISRAFLPEGGVTFKQSLNEETVADIKVLDPVKILSHGEINKNYENKELRQILSDIFVSRDDPEGVLEDYNIIGSNEEIQERIERVEQQRFDPRAVGVRKAAENLWNESVLLFRPGVRLVGNTVPHIRFDKVSPLEALNKVAEKFSFEFWADEDGTLNFGISSTRTTQLIDGVGKNGTISLSRYSVTDRADSISKVVLETEPPGWGDNTRIAAVAQLTTGDGETVFIDGEEAFESQETAEAAAAGRLVRAIMNNTYGSMTINGMASEDKDALSYIDVGDIINVDNNVASACNRNVQTGDFIVTSVHHKINDVRGWKINVEVSRYPSAESIQTSSTQYDPRSESRTARPSDQGTIPDYAP